MQKGAFFLSVALHAAVFGLMFLDISFAREMPKPPPAVLMVDLTKVKIADKTNLPQKAVVKKAKKQQTKPTPAKPTPKTSKPTPQKQVKAQAPKPTPKPAPAPKNAVAVQPPKKEQEKKKAPASTPAKKPNKKADYDLKSLLASVEKVRQDAPAPAPTPEPKPEPAPEAASGTSNAEGRMDKLLTISERDYIATKLRDCWYIDGGAQDIEDIRVEVRVYVNKDGSIREAKIMNKMNLPAFKSLSESARRAVYICADKGEESPFKVLANTYADHYNDWKELYLTFNPMDANVF